MIFASALPKVLATHKSNPASCYTLASSIAKLMPGTLHIFRLKPDPLQYQVNYNLGANS